MFSAQPTCHVEADLGFLLDASHSTKAHFDEEKEFLKELAGSFFISDYETQVSL